MGKFSPFTLFTIAYSEMTFARNLSTLRRSRLGRLMNDPTQQCDMQFIFHFIYVDLLNAYGEVNATVEQMIKFYHNRIFKTEGLM